MNFIIEAVSLNGPPKIISRRRCKFCQAAETETHPLIPHKNGLGPVCAKRCIDAGGRVIVVPWELR